jgi:hypothetical protein
MLAVAVDFDRSKKLTYGHGPYAGSANSEDRSDGGLENCLGKPMHGHPTR